MVFVVAAVFVASGYVCVACVSAASVCFLFRLVFVWACWTCLAVHPIGSASRIVFFVAACVHGWPWAAAVASAVPAPVLDAGVYCPAGMAPPCPCHVRVGWGWVCGRLRAGALLVLCRACEVCVVPLACLLLLALWFWLHCCLSLVGFGSCVRPAVFCVIVFGRSWPWAAAVASTAPALFWARVILDLPGVVSSCPGRVLPCHS
eukprot:IDg5160t1